MPHDLTDHVIDGLLPEQLPIDTTIAGKIGEVQLRDYALWIAHIRGDDTLIERLTGLAPDEFFELEVRGTAGTWQKMRAGTDGRQTPGLGLPAAYVRQTGLTSFIDAVGQLGAGQWGQFFDPASTPEEITLHRPFFPRANLPKGEARKACLVRALGLRDADQLLRHCERAHAGRGRAEALFWTLGAKQVGKGALNGWRQVVMPALDHGWLLWPFHGSLDRLLRHWSRVIVETYPAEYYSSLGLVLSKFAVRKTKQAGRKQAAVGLLYWCSRHRVTVAPDVKAQLEDGFGPRAAGEDPFDALVGLAGMIAAVLSYDQRFEPVSEMTRNIEGWIFGQIVEGR